MGKSVEPILATHACAHGFDVNFTSITCLMNKMLGLSCHRPTTLNRLFYFRLCDTCIVCQRLDDYNIGRIGISVVYDAYTFIGTSILMSNCE